MGEEDPPSETVRIPLNLAGALIALESASGQLALAKEKLAHRDYNGAIMESRDAMRLSSSALLYSEGIVSGSLDETLSYLSGRHPGALPFDGWQRAEWIADAVSPGLYNALLSAMGRLKKTGRQQAEEAVNCAEAFVAFAHSELSI